MGKSEMVNGVGGAFVFSEDPERLAAWYTEHLGIEFEGSAEFGAFYRVFVAADPEDPSRQLVTVFSIMKARFPTIRPAPVEEPKEMYGDQPFMVNLRVDDIDRVVDRLAAGGVDSLGRLEEPYGRFAWVRDADGNRVEIYAPATLQGGSE